MKRLWTEEEDAAVLAGRKDLPGRTVSACKCRSYKLRKPEIRKASNQRYDEKRLAAARVQSDLHGPSAARAPGKVGLIISTGERLPFQPHEDEQILAGCRDLPGRTEKSCRMRALFLRDPDKAKRQREARKERERAARPPKPPRPPKAVKPPREPKPRAPRRQPADPRWTPQMVAELLAGRRAFPGFTKPAVRLKIERMRRKGVAIWWRPEGPAYRLWTAEEKAAVTAGALHLPTRTRSQIHGKRKHLGISEARAPLWSEEQDSQLLADPRADLPGRTHRAKLSRLHKLGAAMPRLDALSIRRQQLTKRWQRQEREAARAAPGGILSTASPRADGFDLPAEILRAVPGRLPPHIREEAIAEAALLCLERQISPADAATEALSRARRFIDVDKKHVELNERYHQIPQWSAV